MVDQLKSSPKLPERGRLQVLCLAGGGFMGLFTIEVLRRLEYQAGAYFATTDVFAGTSIGGIIALTLAAGVTTDDLHRSMLKLGSKVFPNNPFPIVDFATQFVTSKFDAAPLADAIRALVGERTLGELQRHVIVPALDLTAGSFRIFRGGRKAPVYDENVTIVDAALASAAAPTYFPIHAIGTSLYADGGLIANAPDAIAAIDVLERLQAKAGRVRMISVGTTLFSPALAGASRPQEWGVTDWLKEKRLLSLSMAAQIELSRFFARSLLREQNVLTIDPTLSANQQQAVGLDKADASAIATLQAVADAEARRVIDALSSKRFLTLWRSHRADSEKVG